MGFRVTEIVHNNLSKCEFFWGRVQFYHILKDVQDSEKN